MSSSPGFVDHALDLLSSLGPIRARAMFGGYGLYAGGAILAVVVEDELFLKTDAATVGRFAEAGCRQWIDPGQARTSYWRPPDEAHEGAEAMAPWARLALEAALRARAEKVARAARPRVARNPAPGERKQAGVPARSRTR